MLKLKSKDYIRRDKMPGTEEIVAKIVAAVAATYVIEGVDNLSTLFSKALQSIKRKGSLKTNEMRKLSESIKKSPPDVFRLQSNANTLSRWLEIPRDDFERTPPDQYNTDVLIRHVYLEQLFASWLTDLGYKVSTGQARLGVEGWEFVPDVYGELETIHGIFQVAVNFVCQDPPSTARVSFVCESLEAYAVKKSPEFSEKDIFMVVTPFKFSATANSALVKEDKDHSYYVVKIESNNLFDLIQARDTQERLKVFQNIVKGAYGKGGQKTWV